MHRHGLLPAFAGIPRLYQGGGGGGDNDCVCVSALVRVCGCERNGVRACCIYVHPRVRPVRAWDAE